MVDPVSPILPIGGQPQFVARVLHWLGKLERPANLEDIRPLFLLILKSNHCADLRARHGDRPNFVVGEHFIAAGAHFNRVFVFGLIFLPLGGDAPSFEVVYFGFVIERHAVGCAALNAFGTKNFEGHAAPGYDFALVFHIGNRVAQQLDRIHIVSVVLNRLLRRATEPVRH